MSILDFSERFLSPDDFVYASHKPVPKPTAADLDAIQNSQLFEGDIVGIPSDEDDILKQRLRDSPMDEYDHLFKRPVGVRPVEDRPFPVPQLAEPGHLPRQTVGRRPRALHAGGGDDSRVSPPGRGPEMSGIRGVLRV